MIDWNHLRVAKRREAGAVAMPPVSEIVPSRRDFGQFLGSGRGDLAVIPTIRRRDPFRQRERPDLDAAALARLLDNEGVAAIAVTTDATYFAGRLDDLKAVAGTSSAPLLHDDFSIDDSQILRARLHGADATVVPVAWVDDDAVAGLVATASSLHMTTVLAVFSAADLPRAVAHDKTIIGLWAQRDDGSLDVDLIGRLGREVPPRRTILLLGDVPDLHDWPRLRGLVDAALVATALLDAEDPAAALVAFLEA